MSAKSAQFEIFKGATTAKGEWYFRLRGRNGEIVLSSEGYTTAVDARRGVASVRRMLRSGSPAVVTVLPASVDV